MQTLTGQVIATNLTQTAKIEVRRTFQHPKYQKSVKVSKKYLVHDTIGVQPGDTVRFVPCRPISKNKRWHITEIVTGSQPGKKASSISAQKATDNQTTSHPKQTTKKTAAKKTTKKAATKKAPTKKVAKSK